MTVPKQRITQIKIGCIVYTLLGLIVSPVFSQVPATTVVAGNHADNLSIKNDKLAGPLRRFVQQSNNTAATSAVVEGVGARLVDGRVGVDIVAVRDAAGLARQLSALGAARVSVFGNVISAWVSADRLEEIASLTNLRQIRMIQAATRTGSVTSQGDAAMEADVARAVNGIDGSGIRVGVLSDTYNCFGDADNDVETGDLPGDIIILDDSICDDLALDEGRVMMQIVTDVAPGASQAFHTAVAGQADFANGIVELAVEAKADVIVDDIFYFAEPFFQDGIISQAIDRVEAMGATYFTAAGNHARNSYESRFRSSGIGVLWDQDGDAHDFDPTDNVDVFQEVTVPFGDTILISMQWDEPFASVSDRGARNDLDFLLLDKDGIEVLASSVNRNLRADPVEILEFTNVSTTENTFNLAIESYLPSQRRVPGKIKYVVFSGELTPQEYDTASSTVVGHANARGAISVGASPYYQTPVFGVSPPILEFFSSAGFTPILFDLRGRRVSILRDRPDIVAPDGGNNTFFGIDTDGDLFPNFFGTSAAAPHAAGVAALMLEQNNVLTPEQIRQRLIASTIDMGDVGFDADTGHGLIVASKALTEPGPVTSELSIQDVIVNEAAGSVAVRLTLDRPSTTDVSVQVYSTPDSATPGSDFYGAFFSSVNIAAGSRGTTVEFIILNDGKTEGREQFLVYAVNSNGASIRKNRAAVTIIDNDR